MSAVTLANDLTAAKFVARPLHNAETFERTRSSMIMSSHLPAVWTSATSSSPNWATSRYVSESYISSLPAAIAFISLLGRFEESETLVGGTFHSKNLHHKPLSRAAPRSKHVFGAPFFYTTSKSTLYSSGTKLHPSHTSSHLSLPLSFHSIVAHCILRH